MNKLSLAVTQLPHHRLLCLLARNTEGELESFLSIPTEVTFPLNHTAHLGHGRPGPSGVFTHEHHNSCVKGADRRGALEYHWCGQDWGRTVRSQHFELPEKECNSFDRPSKQSSQCTSHEGKLLAPKVSRMTLLWVVSIHCRS